MKRPKVIVLRSAGTNCDEETAFAFEKVKAEAELVHINRLIAKDKNLDDYQILAIPGGFTYGDDIAAGKLLANELKYKLGRSLEKFIAAGKLILGICNGFQVLVKCGFLPGGDYLGQKATLAINDSGRFEDRWVYLKNSRFNPSNTLCVWTRGLPEIIYLPVAHAEGKFIPKDNRILNGLRSDGQIVFQYVDKEGNLAGYPANPNGSVENIAGICDKTGRILGLMPHPERHILPTHHPRWMRQGLKKEGDGLQIFRNGVEYANNL